VYLFLALSSGLFWGVWGFGYGRYARAMSHYSVILFTASGAIVVYVIAGTFGQDFLLDSIDIRSGLIGGSLSLLGSVMLLKAVSVGKCGVASGVSATYVLVPLAYSIAIGEAVPTLAIVGSFVIVIGLAIFFLPQKGLSEPSNRPLLSVALALVSAVFYGTAVIVLDIGSKENLHGTLLVSQLPAVALSLVMLASARTFGGLKSRDIAPLLATGLALGLAGVSFYTAADMGDLGIASVLSSISPLATAVLAYVFLKEKLIRTEVTALLVSLAGIALVVV
jgi:drug/metabolite transporter (DMT)-like permease